MNRVSERSGPYLLKGQIEWVCRKMTKVAPGRLRVNCNIFFIFLRKWAAEFMSIILRHSQKRQNDKFYRSTTNAIFFYSLSARTK